MKYGMDDYEAAIRPVKRQLFEELAAKLQRRSPAVVSDGSGSPAGPSRVLEVGIGTGPNFPFFTAALAGVATGSAGEASGADSAAAGPAQIPAPTQIQIQLVGLDPNPEMLRFARESAAQAGVRLASGLPGGDAAGGDAGTTPAQSGAGSALEVAGLVEGDVGSLPFADGEFDAAVCTLVLCSVPSQAAALAELRRVVRPGGSLLLIEHVAAGPERLLMRLAQSVLTPLQRALADGCCLNRDTGRAVAEAGWDAREGGALRRFDLEGMSILAPHVAGVLPRA
ncbi:hypothetical protein HYH03_009667 [Edaphochlamys debaryana]|uniref:Methyltransferase type 11 domain-containing protein n=1 Tax=Edaphochlamys debaryana TaxID=47281 RepID=A0A836BY67_9CHLO|nr:hypothetical protein HYH03_009667 [Edaphochlamys debaryana]|eukprot:KAG2491934.1 hypothetical protein HYH03_009667 [Edaphochlamys debaryana]